MRTILLAALLAVATGGCVRGAGTVAGAYDMISHSGKPLPFAGVRSSRLRLLEDWTVLTYTKRAAVLEDAAVQTDTVQGTFKVNGWDRDCIWVQFQIENQTESPLLEGEVCGDVLTIFETGDVFKKRAGTVPLSEPTP